MNLNLKNVFAKNNGEQLDKAPTSAQEKTFVGEKMLVDSDLRDIANAIYRSLQTEGCESKQIISVSSELLNLVTRELGAKK